VKTKIKKASVIGFVRYSQRIVFANRNRDIFEKEYFEYRFKIFCEVTLKSFQTQTDQNFILLVFHSESMPDHYKKQFEELEAANPFLHNVFVSDTAESFTAALKDSQKYALFNNGVAVTFRIDNDDAVQNDFIHRLSSYTRPEFVGFSINAPTLFILRRISAASYILEERYYPSNSIGLAHVTSDENFKSVLEFPQHHLMNDENCLILLPGNLTGGLQTINGENAINDINIGRAKIYDFRSLKAYLTKKLFTEMNLECLQPIELKGETKIEKIKRYIHLFVPPVVGKIIEKVVNS